MKTLGRLAIAVITGFSLLAPCVPAQTRTVTFSTLSSFQQNSALDGAQPYAGLVAGADATLYGTTAFGGTYGLGTVFELKPPASGGAWEERVLYNFAGGGRDGANPYGGLVFDASGNLYGTTSAGGTANAGTVFKLRPPAHPNKGSWTETILHDFGALGDGANPRAGLAISTNGELYGTTYYGGTLDCPSGCGAVFELAPPASAGDAWTEAVIHSFRGTSYTDGSSPVAGVLLGRGGVVYGTTFYGVLNYGSAFELTPPGAAGGPWTELLVHGFGGTGDCAYPQGALSISKTGALFGTTSSDAVAPFGAVFKLEPPGYTESIYAFSGANGSSPYGGLVVGANGALYGTTVFGGSAGMGTVFELIPPTAPGGTWKETVLHNFTGENGDGAEPYAGLIIGANGVLYGTTAGGGNHGWGTVFALTP